MRQSVPRTAWIHGLGTISFCAFLAYAAASYLLAAAVPGEPSEQELAMIRQALAVFGLEHRFADWFALVGYEGATTPFLLGYVIPLVISIVAFLGAMTWIRVQREPLPADVPDLLRKWAIAFAIPAALSFPVIVHDFWLSVAWGRAAAEGLNPYHQAVSERLMADLPLEEIDATMTWGPVWALVAGAVSFLARNQLWVEAALYKVILLVAYLGLLRAVDDVAAIRGARARAVALLCVGWLPAAAHLGLSEGHNDLVTVCLMMLWLRGLMRQERWSALWLVLGTLVKYVTAPLLIVDAAFWLGMTRIGLRRYIWQMVPAGLLTIGSFAVYLRDVSFFEGVRNVGTWTFFRPVDALTLLQIHQPGWPVWVLSLLVPKVFLACLLFALIAWALLGDHRRLFFMALAVMAYLLYARAGHVWPWYTLWCLPLAALVHDRLLGRFCIGVAMVAPFMILPWTLLVDGGEARFLWPATLGYGVALLYAGLAGWGPAPRVSAMRRSSFRA